MGRQADFGYPGGGIKGVPLPPHVTLKETRGFLSSIACRFNSARLSLCDC